MIHVLISLRALEVGWKGSIMIIIFLGLQNTGFFGKLSAPICDDASVTEKGRLHRSRTEPSLEISGAQIKNVV